MYIYVAKREEEARRGKRQRKRKREDEGLRATCPQYGTCPAKVLTAPWGIFVPVQRLGRSLARSTPFLPPRSPLNKYLNRTTTTTPPLVAARSASRSRYYAFPVPPPAPRTHARRYYTCMYVWNNTEKRIFSELHNTRL